MDLKVCTICKRELEKSEFNKKSKARDNLQPHCRDCNQKSAKAYYARNKEHHCKVATDLRKKRMKIVRQYIYDFLCEKGCVDCGEKNPVCLEFDHIENKYLPISQLIRRGASLGNVQKEIAKCEVRCANCHRKKTAKDFNWYKDLDTSKNPCKKEGQV